MRDMFCITMPNFVEIGHVDCIFFAFFVVKCNNLLDDSA